MTLLLRLFKTMALVWDDVKLLLFLLLSTKPHFDVRGNVTPKRGFRVENRETIDLRSIYTSRNFCAMNCYSITSPNVSHNALLILEVTNTSKVSCYLINSPNISHSALHILEVM